MFIELELYLPWSEIKTEKLIVNAKLDIQRILPYKRTQSAIIFTDGKIRISPINYERYVKLLTGGSDERIGTKGYYRSISSTANQDGKGQES
jgi:hypothetical protein